MTRPIEGLSGGAAGYADANAGREAQAMRNPAERKRYVLTEREWLNPPPARKPLDPSL